MQASPEPIFLPFSTEVSEKEIRPMDYLKSPLVQINGPAGMESFSFGLSRILLIIDYVKKHEQVLLVMPG